MENVKSLEVYKEDPRIIPRMEEIMSMSLGYRVWIEEILLAPKDKNEERLRKECILFFARRGIARARAKKILSHNPKKL